MVENITNPTYSGLTKTFSISSTDGTDGSTDSSGNNIFVTAVTGSLTASLTSGTPTVGIKVSEFLSGLLNF